MFWIGWCRQQISHGFWVGWVMYSFEMNYGMNLPNLHWMLIWDVWNKLD